MLIYHVKPLDTLYLIAQNFNCPINEIMILNRLIYPIVFPGQQLVLKQFIKQLLIIKEKLMLHLLN